MARVYFTLETALHFSNGRLTRKASTCSAVGSAGRAPFAIVGERSRRKKYAVSARPRETTHFRAFAKFFCENP
jgi:hypothetical protein